MATKKAASKAAAAKKKAAARTKAKAKTKKKAEATAVEQHKAGGDDHTQAPDGPVNQDGSLADASQGDIIAPEGFDDMHAWIVAQMARSYDFGEPGKSDFELAERIAEIVHADPQWSGPIVGEVVEKTNEPPEVVQRAVAFLQEHNIPIGGKFQTVHGDMQIGADIDDMKIPTDSNKPIILRVSMSNGPTAKHWLADINPGRGIAIAGYRAEDQLGFGDEPPDDAQKPAGGEQQSINLDGDAGADIPLPDPPDDDHPKDMVICEACHNEPATDKDDEGYDLCPKCYTDAVREGGATKLPEPEPFKDTNGDVILCQSCGENPATVKTEDDDYYCATCQAEIDAPVADAVIKAVTAPDDEGPIL